MATIVLSRSHCATRFELSPEYSLSDLTRIAGQTNILRAMENTTGLERLFNPRAVAARGVRAVRWLVERAQIRTRMAGGVGF